MRKRIKRRSDDNEETVRKRLTVYHSNAKDLLEFYKANNALYSVYPKKLEEAVSNIKEHLENLKGSN